MPPKDSDKFAPGFTDRLRKIREFFEESQAGMDEFLGLGKKSWQRYESGGVAPGGPIFAALSRNGVNISWLLEGDDAGPMMLEDLRRQAQQNMHEVVFELDQNAIAERKAKYAEYASMTEQQKLSSTLESMMKELKYRPPTVVVYALKEMMYSKNLTLNGALAILRAMKTARLEKAQEELNKLPGDMNW